MNIAPIPKVTLTCPLLPLDIDKTFGGHASAKDPAMLFALNALTRWHYERCLPYANMLERLFPAWAQTDKRAQVPYLPVRLFKTLEMRSVQEHEVVKTLNSSGTSGQAVSRIYLDRETSLRQTQVLSSIMSSFLGKKRWPMVIVDSADLLRDRRRLNARMAGILGFATYGRDHCYCLSDSLELDALKLKNWLARYVDTPVLLFGFTYVVWQGLFQSALKQGVKLQLPPGSILIHGGGWKRLQEHSISNEEFKTCLQQQFGIERVHNYYGMVEQSGSIFMECEYGHLHSPNNADVLFRDPYSLQTLDVGQSGLIQVQSTIPLSYPGHSLLTEDVGTLHGIDDCPCGRPGSHFTVIGRLPQAEMRGCSDTRVMA